MNTKSGETLLSAGNLTPLRHENLLMPCDHGSAPTRSAKQTGVVDVRRCGHPAKAYQGRADALAEARFQ